MDHVLPPARPVELARDACADRDSCRRRDDVDDRPIVALLRIEHVHHSRRGEAEGAAVSELSAGLGIERGSIEHDGRLAGVHGDLDHLGVEAT